MTIRVVRLPPTPWTLPRTVVGARAARTAQSCRGSLKTVNEGTANCFIQCGCSNQRPAGHGPPRSASARRPGARIRGSGGGRRTRSRACLPWCRSRRSGYPAGGGSTIRSRVRRLPKLTRHRLPKSTRLVPSFLPGSLGLAARPAGGVFGRRKDGMEVGSRTSASG